MKITCTQQERLVTSSWFDSVWEKSVVDLVSLGGKIILLSVILSVLLVVFLLKSVMPNGILLNVICPMPLSCYDIF